MTSYFVYNHTLDEKGFFHNSENLICVIISLCETLYFMNEIKTIDFIFSGIHSQYMLLSATAMILVKVTKLGTTRKTSQQIESEQIAIFVESMITDKL